MFSGIVQCRGYVDSVSSTGDGGRRLTVRCGFFKDTESPVRIGDSISVSGVCLTVTALDGDGASFDLGSETLRRTTLGSWNIGREVNLERSLRVGDRLDGHIVQGHVDAVSEVLERDEEGNTSRVLLTLPPVVKPFIVPKGAVTLDGVSLTVGEVIDETFSVYIIPHTADVTTLKVVQPGTLVNVEADCMARYLWTMAEPYLSKLGALDR